MKSDKLEYKSIAKANALFGGIQVFKLLVSFVNSKLVAVLLGPEGMGIMGLLNSSIDLVRTSTDMGLKTSAVKDVSVAHDTGDLTKVATVKTTLSRWVWITGIIGLLATFILAPSLSKLSFGNESYTLHFRVLSLVLLITQVGVQYSVLLQGTRRNKQLATSSVIGQVLCVLLTLPIYYYFGFKGIVPAIIIIALAPTIVSGFACRGIILPKVKLSIKETWINGKTMVIMGFMLGLTGLMDTADAYLIKVAISTWGSVADVGLFNAGQSLVSASVSLAFAAIATDYFPRITIAANKSKDEADSVMNKQFELLTLVLIPLVCLFVAFGPFLLKLFYSSKFVGITNMVSWMSIGMIIRALSWCPAYLFLSKSDPKIYMFTYLINFVSSLVLFVGFYLLWGLTGLGVAFFVNYIIYAATVILTVNRRYGNRYHKSTWRLFVIALLTCGATLGISYMHNCIIKYILFALILSSVLYFCIRELNNRLDLIGLLKGKLSNTNKS